MAITVPMIYDAVTDVVVRLPGATPSLPVAGSSVVDPNLGCRILRVTDALQALGGTTGYSYRTPTAPNQMGWTAEGDRFYVVNDSAAVFVFEFDRTKWNTATPACTFNRKVAWGIEPAFPRVPGKRNIMYGIRFIAAHTLEKYDFTAASGAGAFTTVLDLKTFATFNDNVTPMVNDGTHFTSAFYVSGGVVERGIVNYGGTTQDTHRKVTIFDVNNPTTKRTIHTFNSTVDLYDGNGPQPLIGEDGNPMVMGIITHSLSISNDGDFVRIDQINTSDTGWVYQWSTNRMTKYTESPAGHQFVGWGYLINEDQSGGSGKKMQWRVRSLTDTHNPVQMIGPANGQTALATHSDHQSQHNASSADNALAPFVSECQWGGAQPHDSWYGFWSNEIIAVRTKKFLDGLETVWRFCQHRMLGWRDDNADVGTFNYQPLVQIDPLGEYCLFCSNWDKTLGLHPNPPTGALFRVDSFLVKLGREITVPDADVIWTSPTANVTVTGNTAHKISGDPNTPNGAVLSQQRLLGPGAFIQFVIPDTAPNIIVGFSNDPASGAAQFNGMSHAWSFSAVPGAHVTIRELGIYRTEFAWTPGDTFRIELAGTTAVSVRYLINGVLKYTSLTLPVLPTAVDVSFYGLSTVQTATVNIGAPLGPLPTRATAVGSSVMAGVGFRFLPLPKHFTSTSVTLAPQPVRSVTF